MGILNGIFDIGQEIIRSITGSKFEERAYHSNGKTKSVTSYSIGSSGNYFKNGITREWHYNGNIKFEGEFKYDREEKPVGIHRKWNESGILVEEIDYYDTYHYRTKEITFDGKTKYYTMLNGKLVEETILSREGFFLSKYTITKENNLYIIRKETSGGYVVEGVYNKDPNSFDLDNCYEEMKYRISEKCWTNKVLTSESFIEKDMMIWKTYSNNGKVDKTVTPIVKVMENLKKYMEDLETYEEEFDEEFDEDDYEENDTDKTSS